MSAKCGKFNRHPGSISAPATHRQSEICPQSVLHRATSATLSCPRPSRRLLRYCARPAFALERCREIDAEHLVYGSIKPGPGGSVSLMLTPLELIGRLAALIPPRRRHRHRHYAVLAPTVSLRAQVRFRQNSSRRNDQVFDYVAVCSWPAAELRLSSRTRSGRCPTRPKSVHS
ncbi:MAG: transposase [Candidatus Accumulibacter necessarius]|jgi:hypothetical protein